MFLCSFALEWKVRNRKQCILKCYPRVEHKKGLVNDTEFPGIASIFSVSLSKLARTKRFLKGGERKIKGNWLGQKGSSKTKHKRELARTNTCFNGCNKNIKENWLEPKLASMV